jgi:hypothetical protein
MRRISYSLPEISRALMAHLRDPVKGEWAPMPANIIAHIDAAKGGDGRPAPDEAWAIALRGFDEAETVVWTVEIQQSLEIVRPILARRDSVGARKAFLDVYGRLVNLGRQQGLPAKWTASLGTDPARREGELQRAANAGLLPAPAVDALPAPEQVYPEGLAMVKAAVAKLIPADEKLAQRRAQALAQEQEATAMRKSELAAQVAEKVKSDGNRTASVRGAARAGTSSKG